MIRAPEEGVVAPAVLDADEQHPAGLEQLEHLLERAHLGLARRAGGVPLSARPWAMAPSPEPTSSTVASGETGSALTQVERLMSVM